MPNLTVKSNGGQIPVETFDLKLGVNKLGRTSDNHLQIPSQTVSTLHCEIVWMDDAVLVRDLNSTNGTFIDGVRITESRLEAGQVLRVGDVELCLDTDKASISVPRFSESTVAVAAPPSGTLPCAQHPSQTARYHCPNCEKDFCEPCVRTLKLDHGGHIHKLCPFCSTHCEPIVYQQKRKRRSLLQAMQSALGLSGKDQTQKM